MSSSRNQSRLALSVNAVFGWRLCSRHGSAAALRIEDPPLHQEDFDFLHSFQSPMVAAAMSLTAVRSHLAERLFRSAMIRVAALAVPRWTFAVSQAMA